MVKLIIVRHCQAQGNLERFFQGRIDTDITPVGRAQIGAVSEMLCAEPIDVIYTTLLRRARATAEGINVYHDVEIKTDNRLAEIDAGSWEGKYLSEIEKTYPEEFSKWKNDPAAFVAPGGESMKQVYDRTSAAIEDIIRDNNGKTVCIVSHGCAIKNLMCYLHGLDFSQIGDIPIGTNTAVNVVIINDGSRDIIIENDTDHLKSIN